MVNLSGKTCLIDTNVLVAVVNANHQFHLPAKGIFEQALSGVFRPCISSQNLLELSAVLVHGFGKSRKVTAEDIVHLSSGGSIKVIYPEFQSIATFVDLIKSEIPLHMTDLFLLSTAIAHNLDYIITGDEDFSKINKRYILIHNPFL